MIRRLIRGIRNSQQTFLSLLGKLHLHHQRVSYGPRLTLLGRPIVARAVEARIEIGSDVILCSHSRYAGLGVNHPVVLRAVRPGAEIRIGDRVGITGATVVSFQSVTIGAGSLLGANVMVVDSDFHPLEPARRHEPMTSDAIAVAPVRIEENVFLGANSIVLKGVTIGANSVIGAGSVVTKDVPPNVIAAGNPCRVVKSL
jgi:acetyltransferase-like isoleucine patch superfamily enzyme